MQLYTKDRVKIIFSLYKHELGYNVFKDINKDLILVIEDIVNNKEEIEEVINKTLFNYTIDRLSNLDRSIIFLATYELMFSKLPINIIINDAVKITKIYSDLDDQNQHKFTNKLLDNIAKKVRKC